jgi:hypothetical protein
MADAGSGEKPEKLLDKRIEALAEQKKALAERRVWSIRPRDTNQQG